MTEKPRFAESAEAPRLTLSHWMRHVPSKSMDAASLDKALLPLYK